MSFDPVVLGLRVAGAQSSGEVPVYCPYHDDGHPSASFNVRKGLFVCFACGVAKNATQLANDLGGTITGKFSGDLPVMVNELKSGWSKFTGLKLAIDNDYLRERNVSNDQVTRYKIMECPGRIVFPITDLIGTTFVGVIVRQINTKPRYLKLGKMPVLWPTTELLDCSKFDTLFLVEGIFSVLWGQRSGIPVGSIFSSLGVSGVDSVLNLIDINSSALRKKIVAIMDPDLAGQIAAAKLVKAGIRVVVGHNKSPDEWKVETWRTAAKNVDKITTLSVSDIAATVDPDRRDKFYNLI